jgi:uncharacterized protein
MVDIEFSRFSFHVVGNQVKGLYGNRYSFSLPLDEFKAIDEDIIISQKKITFPNHSEKSANNKLNPLLNIALNNLTNTITNKPVIYITSESNIPLIGAVDFGIVDRNTNVLEIKPLTGCNFNCIYCSVNEGQNKKAKDILIDEDYLIHIAKQLALTKKNPVEFNINPNGEPLLYPFLTELISGLKEIPSCKVISINTNASLLTKEKIDVLKSVGLSRINISLNTLDFDLAKKLSGGYYDTKHTLEIINYCKETHLPILIAPLIVPTYNDRFNEDFIPLVKLATTIESPFPTIGFQKFLYNKSGRNPVEEISFEEFFSSLYPLEEQFNVVLTPKKEYNLFGIVSDTSLEKPFTKNQIIKAKVLQQGRLSNELWCSAENRLVKVKTTLPLKGNIRIKIVRDKHNIFLGVPA